MPYTTETTLSSYSPLQPVIVEDPGNVSPLTAVSYGNLIELSGQGTRKLTLPDIGGVLLTIRLASLTGASVVVTCDESINSWSAADYVNVTFAEVGELAMFISIASSTSSTGFRWQMLFGLDPELTPDGNSTDAIVLSGAPA